MYFLFFLCLFCVLGSSWFWPKLQAFLALPSPAVQTRSPVDNPWLTLQRLGQEIPASVVRIQAGDQGESTIGFGVIVDPRAYVLTSWTLVRGRTVVPLRVHAPPTQPELGQVSARFVSGDEFSDMRRLSHKATVLCKEGLLLHFKDRQQQPDRLHPPV